MGALQRHAVVVYGDAVVEHTQLQLEVLVACDAAQAEAFPRDTEHSRSILVICYGCLQDLLRHHHLEIVGDSLQRHVLH